MPLFSHVFPFTLYLLKYFIFCQGEIPKELVRVNIATSIHAVVRGDKTRMEYAVTLQRHRATVVIQKWMKGRIARKKLRSINDASIVIQSGKI